MSKAKETREYNWTLNKTERAASYAERWKTRRAKIKARSKSAKKAAATRKAKVQ